MSHPNTFELMTPPTLSASRKNHRYAPLDDIASTRESSLFLDDSGKATQDASLIETPSSPGPNNPPVGKWTIGWRTPGVIITCYILGMDPTILGNIL
jgi:hypothetical protein